MKVINLLNKIANGEEVPRFIYEGKRYEYNKNHEWFDDLDDISRCKDVIFPLELNDEIEIIEDTPKGDKKIEKLNEHYYHDEPALIDDMAHKINEIIDKINGGEQ